MTSTLLVLSGSARWRARHSSGTGVSVASGDDLAAAVEVAAPGRHLPKRLDAGLARVSAKAERAVEGADPNFAFALNLKAGP